MDSAHPSNHNNPQHAPPHLTTNLVKLKSRLSFDTTSPHNICPHPDCTHDPLIKPDTPAAQEQAPPQYQTPSCERVPQPRSTLGKTPWPLAADVPSCKELTWCPAHLPCYLPKTVLPAIWYSHSICYWHLMDRPAANKQSLLPGLHIHL